MCKTVRAWGVGALAMLLLLLLLCQLTLLRQEEPGYGGVCAGSAADTGNHC